MLNHVQITVTSLQPEQRDVLIAQLAEAGYEGFEETESELKAFITESNYDKASLHELAFRYQLSYTEQLIPEQNWNETWESNFHPVMIDDFVQGTPWIAIRADFHEPIKEVEHEIVITPKMSFGTGHHATTFMMVQQIRTIAFDSKSVFDFGTGTGVLAILAEKLGAVDVLAIDNDDWSITNAEENIQRNDCNRIRLKKANDAITDEQYDIILANINKNVILDNFSSLVRQLAPKGTLLLSGLLLEDEADILAETRKYPLILNGKTTDRGWICLRFNY
ncbi:MAG: 50S ribosomal protein L11 methyltransferase [Bacteroidota bacterium]